MNQGVLRRAGQFGVSMPLYDTGCTVMRDLRVKNSGGRGSSPVVPKLRTYLWQRPGKAVSNGLAASITQLRKPVLIGDRFARGTLRNSASRPVESLVDRLPM